MVLKPKHAIVSTTATATAIQEEKKKATTTTATKIYKNNVNSYHI